MGKYDKFKKLVLPLSIVKNTVTTSLPGLTGRVTVASPGNEGIDLAEWFQERLDDDTIIIDASSIANLSEVITLTGLPGGSTTLGTFTGSIITNNTTIVNALQELETYIEGIGTGAAGIYGGSDTVPTSVVATLTDSITFTTDNVSGYFFVNIGDLSGSNLNITNTQARLRFYDLGSNNEVIASSTGISLSTFGGDGVTITGRDARYQADYSGTYTNRSLVDKEYVDGLLASGLPSGTISDILVHDGTGFVVASPMEETISGITGSTVTLAASPLSYTKFELFRNGQRLIVTDDYTRSGATITIIGLPLISTDKITATYYI